MSNVYDINSKLSILEKSMKSGDGSEPPMEARIAKLEAIIPTLATKLDLADLRTDFHKEINNQTWKIITAMLTFGSILTAAVYFIAHNVH